MELPSSTSDQSVGAVTPVEATAASGGVDFQSYIGRQLKAVYDDVAKQPIPDRFLALMKQLEEQSLPE